MILGGKVPDFTRWPLAMYAEQRDKGAKLAPAGLQLAPLFHVLIFHACLVIKALGLHITILHAETTLVHTPERKSRHRVIQACSHLRTHILPTGSDIATPCGCGIALFTCKTTAGKQEHALVRIHRALSVVDSIGINNRIGIEIFCCRTQSSRSTQGLAIPHRRAIADIGFGVHPPSINTIFIFREQVLVHLSPEHFTSAL